MKSFKVILEAFTGAKTTTWVNAKDADSAIKIAENRVNNKSPNGWKAILTSQEDKPESVADNWNQ